MNIWTLPGNTSMKTGIMKRFHFEGAIKINPDNAKSYLYMGIISHHLNNVDASLEYFSCAIEKDITYWHIFNYRI